MQKHFLILVISILSYSVYAQNTYEKGYFINNIGIKTDCLIKNLDWESNPTEFKYKLSENAKIKQIGIELVKEFGITGISKYTRFYGNIDRASDKTDELSEERNPIFKKEKLFLKVLLEGDASLYQYSDMGLIRYFYKTKNLNIEQLVYKRYLGKNNKSKADFTNYKVLKNTLYRQQLWNHLKCHSISIKEIKRIKYYEKELINFFIKYNECINSNYTSLSKKKSNLFHLNIRPGINSYSIDLINTYTTKKVAIKPNPAFRFGVEAEVIMPFNNNKWSFIVEPTYQHLKSEEEVVFTYSHTDYTETRNVIFDYKSLEIPFGIRYYLFLNNKSKLFINTSYIVGLSFNSEIALIQIAEDASASTHYEIGYRDNFTVGFGYKYDDKLSAEIRYGFVGDVLPNYVYWFGEYQSTSLLIGYTLF